MLSAAAEATEPTSPLPPDCVPAARSTNAAAAGVAQNDTITWMAPPLRRAPRPRHFKFAMLAARRSSSPKVPIYAAAASRRAAEHDICAISSVFAVIEPTSPSSSEYLSDDRNSRVHSYTDERHSPVPLPRRLPRKRCCRPWDM